MCVTGNRDLCRHLSKQSQNMPVGTVLGYLCPKSFYWYVMAAIFWLREHNLSYRQEFPFCSFPINIPSSQMGNPAQNNPSMQDYLTELKSYPKLESLWCTQLFSSEWQEFKGTVEIKLSSLYHLFYHHNTLK